MIISLPPQPYFCMLLPETVYTFPKKCIIHFIYANLPHLTLFTQHTWEMVLRQQANAISFLFLKAAGSPTIILSSFLEFLPALKIQVVHSNLPSACPE